MIKSVLFDFDGTIVDTNNLIIDTLKETVKSFLNRQITEEDIQMVFGRYLEDQMKLLSEIHYKEMVEYYREYYKKNQDNIISLFPGIYNILNELKKSSIKIAIVSAKGKNGIFHCVEKFGLQNLIDVIISSNDVINNKPHPEPAFKALSLLDSKPSEALFVGDSPYDILCGKSAGIKTVLVGWSIFNKANFSSTPDYIIHNPSQLLDIIKIL